MLAEKNLLRLERKRQKDSRAGSAGSAKTDAPPLVRQEIIPPETQRFLAAESKGWNAQNIKVSFQLCASDRVALETYPPNIPCVVDLVRSVRGHVFDNALLHSSVFKNASQTASKVRSGLWTFPLDAYDTLVARVHALRNEYRNVHVLPLSTKLLQSLQVHGAHAEASESEFERLDTIPTLLVEALYPFQVSFLFSFYRSLHLQ